MNSILDLTALICIMIPGAIWIISARVAGFFRNINVYEVFSIIIIINFLIAFTLYWFYKFAEIESEFSYFDFIDGAKDFNRSELIDEIIFSIFISLSLPYIFSIAIMYYSIGDRIFRKIYGKLLYRRPVLAKDVWRFAHKFCGPNLNYCDFFDFKNNLVYKGKFLAYSDSVRFKEIFFLNAEIYDLQGNFQSTTENLYVSCPVDQVRIEIYEKGENSDIST